jgi:NitT/TauT family transport system substrate-binding protein
MPRSDRRHLDLGKLTRPLTLLVSRANLRRPWAVIVLVSALALIVVSCGPRGLTPATKLSVGLGYIPSVQFAQFYRAQQQGYYAAAGLDVTFQNQIDPQLITLLGQGAVDVGMADGTSIIPAAGQGIPVRYAATVYARFPNVVISGADSGITAPADLHGKRIGTPGRYGSSWIMLQALLASAGLTPDDVTIVDYPDFGQAVGLRGGQVDAITGFANNEPVQLEREGFAVNMLTVDQIVPLPGPGLSVGEGTLSSKPAAVRAFIEATLRAMREIIADPSAGLDDSIAVVPELGADRETQLAILQATITQWQNPYSDAHGLGAIDLDAWRQSLDFMRSLPDANVPDGLTYDQLVTEDVLP